MKDRKLNSKKDCGNEKHQSPILHRTESDNLTYTDPLHGNKLLKKLHDLYKREQLCDVKLCVGDNFIYTHRSVLASNSPYFEKMFLSNLLESEQDSVNIKSIRYEILQSLVNFCYTASVEVNNDNALELLSGANMLQFDGIKLCCCTFLEEKLDFENCLIITRFAELHACTNLKQVAEEYSRKHFKNVVKTEQFLSISLEHLLNFLSSETISISSEVDIFRAIVTWVKHNEEWRRSFFYELFKKIRLIDIPPKLIEDLIEEHEYIRDDIKCIKLLSKTKARLLLPPNYQCADNENISKNKPRQFFNESSVYLIGGETRSKTVFDTLECFSVADKKWSYKASMSRPRDGLGVTTYDGKVFVAGGFDGINSLTYCECYSPENNSWCDIREMNEPRHAFSMSELQGWLYIAGGSNCIKTEYDSVERYDPVRDDWQPVASMMNKREGLVLLSYDRVLYAIGGENGVSILNTVERFDPRMGVWCNCSSMGYRRRYFGATVLNEKIYSIGGSDYEEDLNSVETFEVRANRWIPIPSMNKKRESIAVVTIDETILVMGGACIDKEMDSIERYDPILNKWEDFGSMTRAKEGMGVVAL